MLEVSREALDRLNGLLDRQKPETAIRIAVVGGNGPGLGLFTDAAGKKDVLIRQGDIPFIIDRSLLEYCQSITIGFRSAPGGSCGNGTGFLIVPANPVSF